MADTPTIILINTDLHKNSKLKTKFPKKFGAPKLDIVSFTLEENDQFKNIYLTMQANSQKQRLSIITVNKNNADGLERTIQSVINQTFKEFEYIIIDGASTDGSIDVIRKYEDKINYWVSEPDTGIYNAMNKGIKVAKGDYLLFLNSGDNLVNYDVLERAFTQNFNEDIVYGKLKYKNQIRTFPERLTLKNFIFGYLPHPSTFIKASLFDEIGLYDESLKIVADWKFFIQAIIINNFSYRYLNITISEIEDEGISADKEQMLKENNEVLKKLFPRIYPDYLYFKPELEKCKTLLNIYQRSRIINFIKRLQETNLYLVFRKLIKYTK